MPRKTRRSVGAEPVSSGFNEAAARCHGKPTLHRRNWNADSASMRPRPDATENPFTRPGSATLDDLASMRPRPDATENELHVTDHFGGPPGFNEAAARCHGKLGP